MLNEAKTLKGYKLNGLDGELGRSKNSTSMTIIGRFRYLVADTGNWLVERQVLISPHALSTVNKDARNIAINLTKKQIENSPSLASDKPVSRQFEEAYYGYYAWPMYWAGPYMWGDYPYPYIGDNPGALPEATLDKKGWDPHLRSTRAVTNYAIQAKDGEIGHVSDFIIDNETWAIRYLMVDTGNGGRGK